MYYMEKIMELNNQIQEINEVSENVNLPRKNNEADSDIIL